MQQGYIRQAFILWYAGGGISIKTGRFILPIGLPWDQVSFTAKDAPHIVRIDTEASYGFQVGYDQKVGGRQFANISLSGIIGDGGKYHDYVYPYGIDGSLDSNSWPGVVLAGSVNPTKELEFRAALKLDDSGSKVERVPSFFFSKRNSNSLVFSARYTPIRYLTVFGEKANYTWGLKKSSAEMLGQSDTDPVRKNGYYVGVDASYPVKQVKFGTIFTYEDLSRDDALIKWLSSQGLYNVTMGKKERSTAIRFYADIANALRVGFFRNDLSNPFPWVSGIAPVSGERAYQSRPGSKWGVVFRFTLQ